MRPSLRYASFVPAAFLCAAAWAGPSSAPDVIVVGEPTASDALAPGRTGPVTLSYLVLEVFHGEPGSDSVVVRHDELVADDRARLREGDRAILLLRADASHPGRYVAPPPLRATPSAVAAFRKWSAPEDVRAARPVSAVVAEIQAGGSSVTPEPARAPAPIAAASRSARAAEPLAAAAPAPARAPEPPRAPKPPASAVHIPEEQVVDSRFEKPAAPLVEKPTAPPVATVPKPAPPAVPRPATPSPPARRVSASLLPPLPPPQPLGPALSERRDLAPPPPPRHRR